MCRRGACSTWLQTDRPQRPRPLTWLLPTAAYTHRTPDPRWPITASMHSCQLSGGGGRNMGNGLERVHLRNLQASCIEAHATAQCRWQTAWLRAQLSTVLSSATSMHSAPQHAQHSTAQREHPPVSSRCPAAPPPAAPGRVPAASGCRAPARVAVGKESRGSAAAE